MKHKWAELIQSWAMGAEIEQRDQYDMGGFCDWFFTTKPNWNSKSSEFRLRQYPKPDVIGYAKVCGNYNFVAYISLASPQLDNDDNLKLIWDGETGKLKSAEVIL
jgi:hypothetical protein